MQASRTSLNFSTVSRARWSSVNPFATFPKTVPRNRTGSYACQSGISNFAGRGPRRGYFLGKRKTRVNKFGSRLEILPAGPTLFEFLASAYCNFQCRCHQARCRHFLSRTSVPRGPRGYSCHIRLDQQALLFFLLGLICSGHLRLELQVWKDMQIEGL